jgi:hypothetical protein
MSATELGDHLKRYLAVRSALGYRNYAPRNLMQDFVRYVCCTRTGSHSGSNRSRLACATAGRNGASRLAYRLSAAREEWRGGLKFEMNRRKNDVRYR